MLGQVASTYREAFSGLPRRVWLLAVVTLVNRSGTMVVPFLSLYLTTQLGFSISQSGRVVALYGVGSVLGSLLGGWLADRVGAVRVVRWSLIGTGAGFIVLSQVHTLWSLAATVLVLSVVAEAFRPAMLSSIALAAPPALRTRSMSLLRLAINLGMSVGPALGGLLAVNHYFWLFVVDAGTCWMAVAALAATGLDDRAHPPPTHALASGPRPWRDLPFLGFLGVMTCVGLVFFQLMSTWPLHLRGAYHLSEDHIGGLLAVNALLVALLEMIIVKKLEHRDPLRVIAVGCLLLGLGFGGIGLGHTAIWALLTVLMWTAGEMLTLPLSNMVAVGRATTGSTGRYVAVYTMSFSVASVVAPLAGTAIYQHAGSGALWAAVAGLAALGSLGCLVLRPHLAPGLRSLRG